MPLVSPLLYIWLHILQVPAILLLLIGKWTRSACIALVFLQSWLLFADQFGFRNHPYFFWLCVCLLAVSPAGEAFGLDGSRAGPAPRRVVAAQRLLQVQVTLVYVCAAINKSHATFLEGAVLAHTLEGLWSESVLAWGIATFAGLFAVERAGAWIGEPGALAPHAWLTLTCEFALPVALWTRRLRGGAMVVGAGFHLGIALATQIWSFSLAMIATYLLFANPDALERLVMRVRAGPAPHDALAP